MITAEPSASPVSTILRVNFQNGPFHNIGDALLEAKIGDKIMVSPGRYKETLRISKAVHIIGDGHVSVNIAHALLLLPKLLLSALSALMTGRHHRIKW